MADELETRAEAMKEGGEATFWQRQLELSDRDHEKWLKQGDDVVERYKSDPRAAAANANARKRANILYSNTEVLKAALFARMAKPDVRRRFSDQDPTGRVIAELIERALIYTNDCNDSESQIALAIEDYCLPGRGIVRVHYEAKVGAPSGPDAPDDEKPPQEIVYDDEGNEVPGPEATEVPPEQNEYVTSQEVWDEYVNWKDYRHEPSPSWDKLSWEAYRHLMTVDDLIENFGENLGEEKIDKIPLDWSPDQDKGSSKSKLPESFKKAEVWEIWDRATKTRVWIVKGHDTVLRKDKDPYGLEDFFPRPKPLQATTTTNTIIPQPEFVSYKDQADALDEIETRIDRLTKALKRRGGYNANIPELKKLATLGDNQFVPIEKWSEFAAGGGLQKQFEAEDFSVASNVLEQLHVQREQRVQAIYEIMGIADIMRGISNPNETLGAQQLKAQFGGNRLKKRQDQVQRFIRDLMRIKAEIIAEHFEPEQLSEMTGFPWVPQPPQQMQPQPQMPQAPAGPPSGVQPGMGGASQFPPQGMQQDMGQQPMPPPGQQQQPPPGQQGPDQAAAPQQAPDDRKITPEMMQVLRTDRLRSYRVDVETDSTIYEDAEAERQSRVELLTAMTQFVAGWLPVIQGQPAMMPLAFEMLAFGVRGFKTGRQLEESIEQTRMQLEQAAASPAPPPPDPQAQAEMAKAQMQQQKNQNDAQLAQAKMQQDGQFQAAQLAQQDKHKQLDLQLQDKHHVDQTQLEREKLAHAQQLKAAEMLHQKSEGDANRGLDKQKFETDIVHKYDAMDMQDEHKNKDLEHQKAEGEAGRAQTTSESEKGRAHERGQAGVLEPGERETFVKSTQDVLGHIVTEISDVKDSVEKVGADINKKVDALAKEIADDQAAPASFETGPDGRIAGFTKGKRKVTIKRDPKTGKMQGTH